MSTNNPVMVKKQRRGTAILETPDGILMNSMEKDKFILPGGRAEKGESRIEAVVRELREETHLHASVVMELFEHTKPPRPGKKFQNYHKVFYVKASGKVAIGNEVKHIGYYKPGIDSIDGRKVSWIHKNILKKYYKLRESKPELFKLIDEFNAF